MSLSKWKKKEKAATLIRGGRHGNAMQWKERKNSEEKTYLTRQEEKEFEVAKKGRHLKR